MNNQLIKFKYEEHRDSDKIDMVFKSNRVEDRKEWLLNYKDIHSNRIQIVILTKITKTNMTCP